MLIKNPKIGVKFLPKNGKFRQPGTTLKSIEDFFSMKTQHRKIAIVKYITV